VLDGAGLLAWGAEVAVGSVGAAPVCVPAGGAGVVAGAAGVLAGVAGVLAGAGVVAVEAELGATAAPPLDAASLAAGAEALTVVERVATSGLA
jgi:hypothetical protein